jgi:hypothetical protein
MANPGAVCGNPRDAAAWWLIVDTDARLLRWHRDVGPETGRTLGA